MSTYQATISTLTKALLAQQEHQDGHSFWTGRLSSSALSTGLACLALAVIGDADKERISSGVSYLIKHQLNDGSWGDTDNSPGNISTTLLVWSAMRFIGDDQSENSIQQAEHWIKATVGSLDSGKIVKHIETRYGKDRTFAVPIIMACCIAGCFGKDKGAWKHVRQLPFELAAFPQSLYALLQLPVVSYALPALIAIGIVRHKRAPSCLWPLRFVRSALIKRCLGKLKSIQPGNGGFLEASPLTAFVAMALAQAGYAQHSVVKKSRIFLDNSQRSDGSWPIDTNLSTWVTSLSIHALDLELIEQDRESFILWYKDQQFQTTHPYTGARPGGWAWTNLPGAVPDADDTSGALLALHKLACTDMSIIERGVEWLLQLQNRDGGMPTFCRGWGRLPFDKSCPDISAHAMRALQLWSDHCSSVLRKRMLRSIERLGQYLSLESEKGKLPWNPLWFGSQKHTEHKNVIFGTARVIVGMSSSIEWGSYGSEHLLERQNEDGSWGADAGIAGTVEETAMAIEALSSYQGEYLKLDIALDKGVAWLCQQWNQTPEPQPIGLYFASLWYYEDLYPISFSLAALNAYKRRKESL